MKKVHKKGSWLTLNFFLKMKTKIHDELFIGNSIGVDRIDTASQLFLIENNFFFGPCQQFVEVMSFAQKGVGIDVILYLHRGFLSFFNNSLELSFLNVFMFLDVSFLDS